MHYTYYASVCPTNGPEIQDGSTSMQWLRLLIIILVFYLTCLLSHARNVVRLSDVEHETLRAQNIRQPEVVELTASL